MKLILTILILTLVSVKILAQNLIVNSSFEDINICEEIRKPCSPSGWFFASKLATRGYPLTGDISSIDVAGSTGSKYLILMVASKEAQTRDYWETILMKKLEIGRKYRISFKITALNKGPNLNDIGFYFTDRLLYSKRDTIIQLDPANYIDFTKSKVKKLNLNWFSIEKDFIATKESSILIIGNFSKSNNKVIARNRGVREVSLVIDDVSVIDDRFTNFPYYDRLRDSIYANKKRHTLTESQFPAVTVDSSKEKPTVVDVALDAPDTLKLANIEFEYNNFAIRNKRILEPFRSKFLEKKIRKIIVVGYTDTQGSDDYNKLLSNKRALEVAKLISENFGIPIELIQSVGMGKSEFYKDKSQNRRVEIFIF